MSSRSIGVTNVSLRRRMMSWVIRSPSCSQIRMSRARSALSGKWRSIWSSRSAARWLFPAASSNRSKNWRSLDTSTCDRRGMASLSFTGAAIRAARGNIAALRDEPRLFDAFGHLRRERGAHALAQLPHRARLVVLHTPVLDLPVRGHDRVRGARVAVEGHAHAAGIHQLDPGLGPALERQVRVPEHEPRLQDALEHLLLRVVVLGPEAAHVRDRRRVDIAGSLAAEVERKRAQLRARLRAERLVAEAHGALHHLVLRSVGGMGRPALAVAAKPIRVERAQELEGLARPRAEQRVVATEYEAL